MRFLLAAAGLLILGNANLVTAANPNEFLNYSLASLPGRLYVPPEAAEPDASQPLILFLHGAGERGSNNTAQVNGNIDNLFTSAKNQGAFLYAPQVISGSWASTTRTTQVMSQVDQAIASYNIEPNRVYVTGLSMGGGGTWNMLSRHAGRFAAAIPIAGVGPAGGFDAANLVGVPTWAFHARDDNVVQEQSTRNVINSILNAAGEDLPQYPPTNDTRTPLDFINSDLDLRYTEFTRGGHGIWGSVYGDQEVRDWMFAQSNAIVPEPATMALLSILATIALVRVRLR